jgi:hypothetical protein
MNQDKDYCFDCELFIEPGDESHAEHRKLSDEKPPDLGVHIVEEIGTGDELK